MSGRLLSRIQTLVGAVGRQSLRLPNYLLELTIFLIRALHDWRQASSLFNRATYRSLVSQIIFGGVDALPTVTLLGFASGVGLVSQLILTVQAFGEADDVIQVLSQVVALELGSLLTAIVMIGRSGSAITTDIANMRLNREIEGLELLGININHMFITPRLLGTAISQMALAVYFSVISVLSGVLITGLFIRSSFFKYLSDIPLAFTPGELGGFLLKNLLFGLIIGTVACYHGLLVRHSPTEVPQQTQRAVINSISIIFVLNALIELTI